MLTVWKDNGSEVFVHGGNHITRVGMPKGRILKGQKAK